MFKIQFNKNSAKKVKKLLSKNSQLISKLTKATDILIEDPFYPSLNTHTVNSKKYGEKYSSRITGDLRFIWQFDQNEGVLEVIEILDIGGHTGSNGVY